MIASLDGTVTQVSGTDVVLEVGGVGYRVYLGPSTLAPTLGPPGRKKS